MVPKFVRILSRKYDEMSSLRLNNGFRLQKTNRAARRWKQPPKKKKTTSEKVISSCVTILGLFQQPWPGVSPTAILNEEKVLRTRLLIGAH